MTVMFDTSDEGETGNHQEALIVSIRLGETGSGEQVNLKPFFDLEDELMHLIEESGTGEYDGNEISPGLFTLYLYGSSATVLWEKVSPCLKQAKIPEGSYAVKRYGGPGAREDRIALPA